jgi:nicotinate-nucleotide pyrophosphorylase (carboxylating)
VQFRGAARFVARQKGVLAGLEAARAVTFALARECEKCGSATTVRLRRGGQPFLACSRYPECQHVALTWKHECVDGSHLESGQVIARVAGSLRVQLACERLALNFLQRLSGVATLTHRFVDAVAGLPCQIYDTRKTTPGWRVLEKYAVRVGGGCNHRMGLHDAVLIKDNHIVVWRLQAENRSLADAVRAARAAVPARTVVEIEVDSIEQLDEALPGEPDIVLLDNMTQDELRRAVAIRNQRQPGLELEASGGITLETVRAVAETGVNRISVGALTHSAPALDIALDFEEPTV